MPIGRDFDARREAVANLIEAAPKLLAALEGFNVDPANIINGTPNSLIVRLPIEVFREAAAALRAARGEA